SIPEVAEEEVLEPVRARPETSFKADVPGLRRRPGDLSSQPPLPAWVRGPADPSPSSRASASSLRKQLQKCPGRLAISQGATAQLDYQTVSRGAVSPEAAAAAAGRAWRSPGSPPATATAVTAAQAGAGTGGLTPGARVHGAGRGVAAGQMRSRAGAAGTEGTSQGRTGRAGRAGAVCLFGLTSKPLQPTDPSHWVLGRGGGGGEAIPRGGAGTGRVFLGIAPWLLSLAGDRTGCQKGGATVTKTDGQTPTRDKDRQTDRQTKTKRKAETDGIPDPLSLSRLPKSFVPR
ncbi:hypothetical protein DBR06_SOUSAS1110194, partial [Sousa chinensis]